MADLPITLYDKDGNEYYVRPIASRDACYKITPPGPNLDQLASYASQALQHFASLHNPTSNTTHGYSTPKMTEDLLLGLKHYHHHNNTSHPDFTITAAATSAAIRWQKEIGDEA